MKGGITSGIVYPRLIARLARGYRFQNIGGTSAGAIAAAACAAAECGRQSGRQPEAFAALAGLPKELQQQEHGRSRLARLFQPMPELRRHFELAMRYIAAAHKGRALLSAAVELMDWPNAIAAALLLLAPLLMLATHLSALRSAATTLAMLASAAGAAWLMHRACRLLPARVRAASTARAALPASAGSPASSAARASADAGAPLHALPLRLELALCAAAAALVLAVAIAGMPGHAGPLNIGLQVPFLLLVPACLGVGLCWGVWRSARALLRGLHRNGYGICSGRSTGAESVTGLTDWLAAYLNQLAGLPPEQPLTFGDLWGEPGRAADGERAINLEVVTTALSQQMPYTLPFRDNAGAFYFDPAEWERLFPPQVMDWLRRHAPAPPLEGAVTAPNGAQLLRLATNARLPVVVAVRMSLSFPILLSAVPVYARDFTDDGQLKRVWFSDGGISSNMPLHFFDSLLPEHPTFAINLKEAHPQYPIEDAAQCGLDGRVFLPDDNSRGMQRYWAPSSDATPAGLFGFLGNILATMQNWRDEVLFPYPGYRDRIVQISLRAGEGGLNLNMPMAAVERLGNAGECAAEMLYRRFHPAGGGNGWENHEQVQVLSVLGNLERLARQASAPGAAARWRAAVGRSRLHIGEKVLARELLADLEAMGAHVSATSASVADRMYKPQPVMKLTPRL
ncbi:patatin-like phospholipase family protein [Pseudoduganella sp. LjRoot289]|uniref:patatin-like phospholipase family protein n=1 Tax=Pseudoduganella sp. LjRoot289 TaxID=3342314 RepID=UPI003ECDAEB4